ncbi:hypothetical protein IW262DRAFT_1118036 [Armillaria fumosa]|nr:hypothetical protein IW262DRAFT_1118036 [Armillaria fumosa]
MLRRLSLTIYVAPINDGRYLGSYFLLESGCVYVSLSDLLEVRKKGIRRAAVNYFGYITRNLGPQDMLSVKGLDRLSSVSGGTGSSLRKNVKVVCALYCGYHHCR